MPKPKKPRAIHAIERETGADKTERFRCVVGDFESSGKGKKAEQAQSEAREHIRNVP